MSPFKQNILYIKKNFQVLKILYKHAGKKTSKKFCLLWTKLSLVIIFRPWFHGVIRIDSFSVKIYKPVKPQLPNKIGCKI